MDNMRGREIQKGLQGEEEWITREKERSVIARLEEEKMIICKRSFYKNRERLFENKGVIARKRDC